MLGKQTNKKKKKKKKKKKQDGRGYCNALYFCVASLNCSLREEMMLSRSLMNAFKLSISEESACAFPFFCPLFLG